jgi:hypothetical protein
MTRCSLAIALIAVLALAVTSVAMAADPIIGTWKLNPAKSKFAPNGWEAPKEQTEVYRESGPDQIELTFKSTEKNGSTRTLTVSFPAKGGIARVLPEGKWTVIDANGNRHQENVDFDPPFLEILLRPGEWVAPYLRDGRQYQRRHKVVSEDGKTQHRIKNGRPDYLQTAATFTAQILYSGIFATGSSAPIVSVFAFSPGK